MRVAWQIFLGNAIALTIAITVLTLTPLTVSYPASVREAIGLAIGLVLLFIANSLVIRAALRPLRDLERGIERVGTPDRSLQVLVHRRDEIGAVAQAFNDMLHRLDYERKNSSRAAIAAQEEERGRVAAELHDEVGQSLTVLILRLKLVRDHAPHSLQGDLEELADAIRLTLDEVRGLAARLRPGALDDLGLVSAIRGLQEVVGDLCGVQVSVAADLDQPLTPEQELVVYRIAQESLTNVLRHAHAQRADIDLRTEHHQVILTITDDGHGRRGAEGTGMSGMRERARLVGGRIDIDFRPGLGTRVQLIFPIHEVAASDAGERTLP